MPSQNINSYYFPNYAMTFNYGRYFDLTLASDERDYDEEVVFSTNIIGENEGNRLPIYFDLSNSATTTQPKIKFGEYFSGNTLVSKNFYNPNNEDFSCYVSYTGICDVGLVGTDNGLYRNMSGETLYYIKGIDDTHKFHPHYRDSRFKMHPVTGYTQLPNQVFSGRSKNTIYNIVSKSGDTIGYYQELYGGFYQGFYKLFGYDYEVFPERVNKGWTAEMLIKPRTSSEYVLTAATDQYLNDVYTGNAGTFFYFGTRSENKYYHNFSGSPSSDTGYTRNTEDLSCIKTCGCSNTGITNSNCFNVYPESQSSTIHNFGCNCGCAFTETISQPETDPKLDVLSNAMSLKLKGDPFNPSICVRYLKLTGDCVTTGSCETEGKVYQTGYTITEHCSPPIYEICNYDDQCNSQEERWVLISAVFERYKYIDKCNLLNLGGLGDIRIETYQSSIDKQSFKLISPPNTHSGSTKEPKVYKVEFNKKWTDQIDYRLGKLKLYVNGYLFFVIENFEEIIPRELNTEKEKQVGVPFNISFGGGTQGLYEHLIFSGCSNPFGPYTQDPELFSNNTLSKTSLSGLSTNILLEQNFGGTFMGGISQFRMYAEPLGTPQIQHNFRLLKNRFNLFDYNCPTCFTNYIIDENGFKILTDNGGGLIFCEYESYPYDDSQNNVVDTGELLVFIDVVFNEGSIVITNNIKLSKTLKYTYKSKITTRVDLVGEPSQYITVEVLVPAGQISGTTTTTLNKDYAKLLDTSDVSSVLHDTSDKTVRVISTSKKVIIEKPRPTPTPQPTPTPTPPPVMNKIYYGKIQNTNFNENYLVNLEMLETNNILSSYLFYKSGPGYCYLLVPENMNQPTLFRNSNDGCNGFIIPFVNLPKVTIVDAESNAVNYYVYRTFVSTKAHVDVWVCD